MELAFARDVGNGVRYRFAADKLHSWILAARAIGGGSDHLRCDVGGLHPTRVRIRSPCAIGKASVRIRKGSGSSLLLGDPHEGIGPQLPLSIDNKIANLLAQVLSQISIHRLQIGEVRIDLCGAGSIEG